ncbi:hypothetical protein PR003_g18680 [Phytophthora rubi]|uniref:CBM1 domain-containing protein n=1 Tax=Phytophthora rubi TaxID=129364 RepID=A0A6A3KH34_9STRA|nr:hypothetical protein PR001_g17603 [Phytophthora rubi]KAE9014714.1 hypothetical protein PR002_g14145 [Phytophthora rubi]KAE9316568.1 hypothetical protein PR003_g18680 [Phytophthora rubi]
MKTFAASAVIAMTLAVTTAGSDSRIHLRMMTSEIEELSPPVVGEWGQCKWIDKQEECEYGLECVVSNDWYGQCLKSVADTWGQCGGDGWTLPCKAGNKCEKKDDWYSQCVPSPDANTKVGEWGQCAWQGYTAECEDNLKCVYIDNSWFGFCVKKQADAYGQCGGYGWSTDCVAGSVCEDQGEAYYQCIPSNDGGSVQEWNQCKWIDNQVNCADGLQCAVLNDWYGQCVKMVADAWGQCGGTNWSGACTDGNSCVKRDDSYSQCVPN